MELIFLGVKYNRPDREGVEVVEGETLGCYRGAAWKAHVAKRTIAHPHVSGLKYRGVPLN